MTLTSYEIFLAICAQQSFQKAAVQLNLTPSAVSHAISAMEKEIGFALFVRGRQQVTLTSHGEALFPHIQAVCNAHSTVAQTVSQLNHLETGHIKIGCFSSVCIHWLPHLVKGFHHLFPHIQLTIYQGTYRDVAQWIKTGQVDLGFLSLSSAQELPFLALYEDPLMCLVPSDFCPKTRGVITLEEMKQHSFITLRESCDADVKAFMETHGFNLHTSCYVEDDQSAAALVSGGMGFCVMPRLAATPRGSHVHLLAIHPRQSRTIGLCTSPACKNAPAVRKMTDYIVSFIQALDSDS